MTFHRARPRRTVSACFELGAPGAACKRLNMTLRPRGPIGQASKVIRLIQPVNHPASRPFGLPDR